MSMLTRYILLMEIIFSGYLFDFVLLKFCFSSLRYFRVMLFALT